MFDTATSQGRTSPESRVMEATRQVVGEDVEGEGATFMDVAHVFRWIVTPEESAMFWSVSAIWLKKYVIILLRFVTFMKKTRFVKILINYKKVEI